MLTFFSTYNKQLWTNNQPKQNDWLQTSALYDEKLWPLST